VEKASERAIKVERPAKRTALALVALALAGCGAPAARETPAADTGSTYFCEGPMGWPVRDGVLGLVEGPAPHDITVLVLSDRVLDEGRKCIAAWCEKLRACLEAGRWPGAVQSEVTWDWAEWGSTEAEEADNDEAT
jgi:hypothetical protein